MRRQSRQLHPEALTMARKYRRFNYARPSFIEGMARIFDFAGALSTYDIPKTIAAKRRADVIALRRDWIAVGNHIRNAIGQFEATRSRNPR